MPGVDLSSVDLAVESESQDWMRYSYTSYIAWTSSDAETICRKIVRVDRMANANVFIVAINLEDGFGFLPVWAWDWIKKDRGYGPVRVWVPPGPF